MYTIINGENKKTFDHALTAGEILQTMCPKTDALACLLDGQLLELNNLVCRDARVSPVTYADDEGRRIYERGVRFILLLAARRVLPGLKIRIENSLGYGVYMRFVQKEVTEEELALLEKEMHALVSMDLPFIKEKWTRERALEYFTAQGAEDKAKLLSYRPYDWFYVYNCGGMAEYFYGAMPVSTGCVKAFSLWKCRDGFVMQLPSPESPDKPAPAVERPRHLAAFDESNEWCRILRCTNVTDVNEMIHNGTFREFIRVNEALQDKSAAAVAEKVARKGARAVFIAGPSSSGKTTFANRLRIQLRVLGYNPKLISLDDFYLDRKDLPLEADGKPDLEALTALDVPMIRKCVGELLDGKTVEMPLYDFHTQSRKPEGVMMNLAKDELLIVEGIHGLNPELHTAFDPGLIFKVFITELTCLNLDDHNRIRTTDARLMRRIVRDHQFRGTPPVDTLAMWASVRRGEEKWIFPYQEQADVVFNSVLHYELPFIRNIAYDLLKRIPADNPYHLVSQRLIKILNYILPAPVNAMTEIPPLSILREFIGGNTFYAES